MIVDVLPSWMAVGLAVRVQTGAGGVGGITGVTVTVAAHVHELPVPVTVPM